MCFSVTGSQENEHVKAIAEFAMDAVEAAGMILIDEDDPKRGYIRIRVGFHSGPVVSNVIGSLNPRVCYAAQSVGAVAPSRLTHCYYALFCSVP